MYSSRYPRSRRSPAAGPNRQSERLPRGRHGRASQPRSIGVWPYPPGGSMRIGLGVRQRLVLIPAKRRSAVVLTFAFVVAILSAKLAMAAPGDLDPTFGRGGKVVTNFGPSSDGIFDIAIQADGKIVAAGVATRSGPVRRFALARYRSGGGLDASFGVNGK